MRAARRLGCGLLAGVVFLSGCATGRKPGDVSAPRVRGPAAASAADRDGPGTNPPAHVDAVADAEPRLEAIRSGGPNKPYQVFGHDYVPMTRDLPFSEHGLASWYGRKFHGLPTASGEPYDMYAMTAAHPTLPIPSYARIRNPANGRTAIVRINDRGPFHSGRIVDLSYAAAAKLDVLRGVAPVELERLTFDDIQSGRWRSPGATDVAAAPRDTEAPAVAPQLSAATVLATPAPLDSASSTAQSPLIGDAPALPLSRPGSGDGLRGFWVQLGAFRDGDGAALFQRRVAADVETLAPSLATFSEAPFYRVQAGPFIGRAEAQQAAQRIREVLGLVPTLVERK